MKLSDRSKSITVVENYTTGVPKPVGNGFFVSSGNRWYLVTCYHVFKEVLVALPHVVDDSQKMKPTIALRVKGKEDQEVHTYSVPLIDDHGVRTWRSCPSSGDMWDVAIVELNRADLIGFDIVAWTEDEFLSNDTKLPPNETVTILSNRGRRIGVPFTHDFPAVIAPEEMWPLAGADGGVISRGLCPGDSGALVYRVRQTNKAGPLDTAAELELVGTFTGAPLDVPSLGLFHYAQTVTRIIQAQDDCYDEVGLELDDGTKLFNRLRRKRALNRSL